MEEPKFLNDVVEMSLYQLATGGKTIETKTVEKGGEIVEVIRIIKEQEPNLKAIELWLKVMKPEVWGELKPEEDTRIGEILNLLDKICNQDEK